MAQKKKPIEMTWEEIAEKLKNDIMNDIKSMIEVDEQGKYWINDQKNNRRIAIPDIFIPKPDDNQDLIKEASQRSLQKKEMRFVINIPEWMKEELRKRAYITGKSMNEIVRLALVEYLSREIA